MLEARGFDVRSIGRQHVDIEAVARAGSRNVLFRALSPFSGAARSGLVPSPSFFSLHVGGHGTPRRWGFWRMGSVLEGAWGAIQCVVGDDFLQVAGGFAESAGRLTEPVDMLRGRPMRFFEAAGPVLDRFERGAATQQHTWRELDPMNAFAAWPSRLGHWFEVFNRLLNARNRQAHRVQARAALLNMELFDDVHGPRLYPSASLPIIRTSAGLRESGTARVSRVGIQASSSRHELGLRLCLCSVSYPSKTLSACQWLANRWAVLELSGAEEILNEVPNRERMERSGERLVWLLDEQETRTEAFRPFVEEVTRQVRTRTGLPYR